MQELRLFNRLRYLRIDGTDGISEIRKNWVVHEKWVYGKIFTTIVIVSKVVQVRECHEISSVPESTCDYSVLIICRFNWEEI